MRVFVVNEKESMVLSKQLNQTGVLQLSTRVEVRGNHLKGNVPVRILYLARFTPDKEFWEKDERYPDEEPYPLHYTKEFLTENERANYCTSRYVALMNRVFHTGTHPATN